MTNVSKLIGGFKNVYNDTNLDCGCLTHEKYFIFIFLVLE